MNNSTTNSSTGFYQDPGEFTVEAGSTLKASYEENQVICKLHW